MQNEDTEYLGIDIDYGDSPSVDLVLNENQYYFVFNFHI